MATVRVSDDGETRELEVAIDLEAAIWRAALVGREQSIPLSFTSLLVGMLAGTDAVAKWLKDQLQPRPGLEPLLERARLTQADFVALQDFTPTSALAAMPQARTTSARQAMEEAQRIAGQLGAVV